MVASRCQVSALYTTSVLSVNTISLLVATPSCWKCLRWVWSPSRPLSYVATIKIHSQHIVYYSCYGFSRNPGIQKPTDNYRLKISIPVDVSLRYAVVFTEMLYTSKPVLDCSCTMNRPGVVAQKLLYSQNFIKEATLYLLLEYYMMSCPIKMLLETVK